MITAGELAKRSGVSKRTIHYYDEIGILKPLKRDHQGVRWYGEEEVILLQKIMFLKCIGYSLDETKSLLSSDNVGFKDNLKNQMTIIDKQIMELEQLKAKTLATLRSIEIEGRVDWDILFELMKMMSMTDDENKKMLSYYFTEEEIDVIKQLPKLGDESSEAAEWAELIQAIKENKHNGAHSPLIQKLAREWQGKVNVMFNGDQELMSKVKKYMDAEENFPLDKELMSFVQEAIAFLHSQRDNRKS